MKLGISTWSLPWAIGVPGYSRPPRSLDAVGLLERALEANAAVVQIADNLPSIVAHHAETLHTMPQRERDRLCNAARENPLTLEVGTRGLDSEHLRHYLTIAGQLDARFLRTVLSGSLCGAEEMSRAEHNIRQVLPAYYPKTRFV